MTKRSLAVVVTNVAAIPLLACALVTPAAAAPADVTATASDYYGDVHVSFKNLTDHRITCSAQVREYWHAEGPMGPQSISVVARDLVYLEFDTAEEGTWHVEWVCSDSQESWGTVPMSPTPTAEPIVVTTTAPFDYYGNSGSALLDLSRDEIGGALGSTGGSA